MHNGLFVTEFSIQDAGILTTTALLINYLLNPGGVLFIFFIFVPEFTRGYNNMTALQSGKMKLDGILTKGFIPWDNQINMYLWCAVFEKPFYRQAGDESVIIFLFVVNPRINSWVTNIFVLGMLVLRRFLLNPYGVLMFFWFCYLRVKTRRYKYLTAMESSKKKSLLSFWEKQAG